MRISDWSSDVCSSDLAARRIAFDDAALHALLVGEAIRMLARRIGELVVAPDQFERRAGPGLYVIAAGQPLAAQPGVGEVLPDALDGAGQHALDRKSTRLNSSH